MISNSGISTEKASKFLDYLLTPITQSGKFYIKSSDDFINKIKNLQTFQWMHFWLQWMKQVSIPREAALNVLREAIDNGENKLISTDSLLKMAEFVLKS